MSGSSGIREDVLHFASDLYKQGQLSANQFINQREEYSSYGRDELSNYTQPKFEAQEFCGSKPYFDKGYFTNNGSYLKGLNKETEKPRRYGNKSVCNFFWKILFIMNIAVVLFAACLANNNIKDPLVEESHLNLNQSQDSLNFNNGEKLKNMDLAFQGLDQLNQDYEMKVINPSSSQSKLSLKSIFSAYHVTFAVVVQVFIWIWYSLNSSNR